MQQELTLHPTTHPANYETASTIESNGSGFFWILCGIIASVIVVCIAIFCIVVVVRYKWDKRTSQQNTKNLKSIQVVDAGNQSQKSHVQLASASPHSPVSSPYSSPVSSNLENKGSNISSVNNNVINDDALQEQYIDDDINHDPNLWRCVVCTYLNDMNKEKCDLCLTAKPKKHIVTKGAVDNENNIIKQQNDRLMIKHWLNRIELIKYFDVFVENGYDSLQIIKEITNCCALIDIGIINKQHQKQLLLEIDKLNGLKNNINSKQELEDIDVIHGKALKPLPALFKALPKAPSEVYLSGHHTARMSMDENGVPDLLNVNFQSELNLYNEGIQSNHNNDGPQQVTKKGLTKI